ncbi:MAG: DUF3868 domain-containing protein [Prevotellaceae bacterium]|nr:DUF3868 domain-containing protein [Prevotellaceae bacterium]
MKRLYTLYILFILSIAAFANSRSAGDVNVRDLHAARFENTMHVTGDIVLDSLTLTSNRIVVLTPILEDKEGHSAVFRSVMLTGRNQHYVYLRQGNENYPNAIEQRRLNGQAQSIAYDEKTQYESWMTAGNTSLRIAVDTCGCGKLIGSNDVVLPVGGQTQPQPQPQFKGLNLGDLACPFVMPNVDAAPEQFVEGAAYVTYELDSITLKPHKFNNPRELMKIYSDIDKVKRDTLVSITQVSIHGFASPEGRYDHNTYLARERAKTLLNWVKKECADNNVKVEQFNSDFTSENWEGLIDSLNHHPEMQNCEAILELAKSDMEPDLRNETIKKKYPKQYTYILKNWYPYLRHADYKVGFRLGQVSVEQIKELIKTRPQVLSLSQFMQAAQTYEPGSAEFNQVFDVAVRMYPDDPTANVNAAYAALMSGNTEGAAKFLQKAGESPEALNARGVLALQEKRYEAAEAFFKEAQAAGLDAATKNLQLLDSLR